MRVQSLCPIACDAEYQGSVSHARRRYPDVDRGRLERNLRARSPCIVDFASHSVCGSRALSSGKGLKPHDLLGSLNPLVVGSAYAAGATADIGSAALQSGLARLGPAGALAGYVIRPAANYLATISGMAVGKNLSAGKSFRSSLSGSVREFEPARDIGRSPARHWA